MEGELELQNWLQHSTQPVCHYTGPIMQGHVTCWRRIMKSCFGIESYTGLCQLHRPCTVIPIRFFKLFLDRHLHGSLQITRVYLHDPCTCVSHRFSWLSSSRELPVYFVSVAILYLFTSPSFPLHSHSLGLHPNTWNNAENMELRAW